MRRPKAQTSFHAAATERARDELHGHRLDDAEDQPADDGAPDVADAAEHGGGERLEAGEEAHPEVDVADLQALRDTGDGGEGGAEVKATTMIRSTLMPIRRAVSGSWETACMPRPVLVRLTKYQRPAAHMTRRRW